MGDGPHYKVVMLGATGVGKSSVANSMLNKEKFVTSASSSSCTKMLQKETGVEEKYRLPFDFIDVPGFGDSDGQDPQIMQMILSGLQAEKFINAFVVVLNGTNHRYDMQTFNMLKVFKCLSPHPLPH
jgi:GTP-binding protein EngB required for normal cell division